MIADSCRQTRHFRTALPGLHSHDYAIRCRAGFSSSETPQSARSSPIGSQVRKRLAHREQRPQMSNLVLSFDLFFLTSAPRPLDLENLAPSGARWKEGGSSVFIATSRGSRVSQISRRFMTSFLRHCVECPKCLTRYLIAFSPYCNGSYLLRTAAGFSEEYILYCSCGRPPASSRWRGNEVRRYAVSKTAYSRGFGTPEEIVPCPISRKGNSG
jgi:hypothetical protein